MRFSREIATPWRSRCELLKVSLLLEYPRCPLLDFLGYTLWTSRLRRGHSYGGIRLDCNFQGLSHSANHCVVERKTSVFGGVLLRLHPGNLARARFMICSSRSEEH